MSSDRIAERYDNEWNRLECQTVDCSLEYASVSQMPECLQCTTVTQQCFKME